MKFLVLTLFTLAASVIAKTGPGAAVHAGNRHQGPISEVEAPVPRVLVPACGSVGAPACPPEEQIAPEIKAATTTTT
ncbi:putative solute carrier family 35 member [Venturia inaequalis]|nr:putative solute carrier family 35 member [Venturia inaequalis]